MTTDIIPPPKIKAYDQIAVLNFKLSTITLAGQMFPAGLVICPAFEDEDSTDEERMLGGQAFSSWSVFVPMENGFIVEIERVHYSRPHPDAGWHWSMSLWYRACFTREESSPERSLYLPMYGEIVDGEIFAYERASTGRGVFSWSFCEPDWMAETITRIGTMTAHKPEESGPEITFVKLDTIEWEYPSKYEEQS